MLLYSEPPSKSEQNSHNETNEKGSGDIIPSQVRHCAVTPKIIINFGRTLSEHVAQLKFGNKPGKVYAVFIRL